MRNSWHIKGGRIIDPCTGRDEVGDIFIENGLISSPPPRERHPREVIDAHDMTVVPGLLDIHVHFREPGREADETVSSGSAAAARGGFTTVVSMPNTTPPVDTPERVARQREMAQACGKVALLPAASLTRGRAGIEVSDFRAMAEAGAIAFTDDGSTVADPAVMLDVMTKAKELDSPIMDHALDPFLAGNGVMREGARSAELGLPGIPSSAEISTVRRDIEMAAQTGCRTHIQHVSTREAVDLIRAAREQGLPVSGEVTPHHLAFSDRDIDTGKTNLKVNPPLGTTEDIASLVRAITDGALQAFATDHAPHGQSEKQRDFVDAPFGAIGLETAVGATYTQFVSAGLMDVMTWLRRWTTGPAEVLGLPPPSLTPGQPANLTILDLDHDWIVRSSDFLSRSRNTPFEGHRLIGRAITTFLHGRITWQSG